MLFQEDVRLSIHTLNLFYVTDFECEEMFWEANVFDLENFGEVAVTKLFKSLEMVVFELVFGHLILDISLRRAKLFLEHLFSGSLCCHQPQLVRFILVIFLHCLLIHLHTLIKLFHLHKCISFPRVRLGQLDLVNF